MTDYALDYAKAVTSKKIIAGPHVRAACRRHIKDLKEAKKRGYHYDIEKANRVIEFSQEICCLNGGDFEGVPFDPLLWQKFILCNLFGWVKQDGTRRFRTAFVETSKGSGKSPLAGLIGIYGLVADNEPRAEIYAAASKKDQAMILFRDAVAMRNLSPYLKSKLKTSGTGANVWNLAYIEKGAFFRPISADDGQSGPRPHVVLLDEIHEHRNDTVIEMMRAGTKGRRQALIFMITNSGHDKTSVCWNYHEYAIKVASGVLQDDSFFSYVCAMDKDDEPFDDEDCWIKTNPSLGVTIQKEYIREQVTAAKGMPSKESVVRRLNFSQWVGASNPWLSQDVWMAAQNNYSEDDLIGRECFAGLDLSSVHDLTAFVLLFPPTEKDQHWRILPYFWLPEEGLYQKGQRDGVDYINWVNNGHLLITPGKVIDKSFVCAKIAEISSKFNLLVIGYDRWRIDDLRQVMSAEGININLQDFGQGYKDMAPAVDEFERLLLSGKMKHNGNPCMTFCAANTVISADPANNRKPAKDKSTGRIDGIVAAVMAIGKSINYEKQNDMDSMIANLIIV